MSGPVAETWPQPGPSSCSPDPRRPRRHLTQGCPGGSRKPRLSAQPGAQRPPAGRPTRQAQARGGRCLETTPPVHAGTVAPPGPLGPGPSFHSSGQPWAGAAHAGTAGIQGRRCRRRVPGLAHGGFTKGGGSSGQCPWSAGPQARAEGPGPTLQQPPSPRADCGFRGGFTSAP